MPKDAPFPKVAGIIMNGDRYALIGRVKRIQNAVWNYAGMEPKLQSLPIFVIYFKCTNVYLEISKLDAKVDAGFAKADPKMDARFAKMDAKMDAGFAKMDAVFAKMDAGFAKIDAKMDAGFAVLLVGIVGLFAVVLIK